MSKVTPIVTFILGAAIGGVTSWQLLKKHYESQYEKDLESVKAAFGRKPPVKVEKKEETIYESPSYDKDLMKAAATIVQQRYASSVPEVPKKDHPYVVSPDEFGEFYEYEKVYLTFYADGAIADADDCILTNDEIEASIGFESLNHFGEYEDDVIYVRNDAKRCDYEVTKDPMNYSEIEPTDDD